MISSAGGDGGEANRAVPANQRGWLRRGMDSVMGIQAPQQGGGNTVASEGGTGIFPAGYGSDGKDGLLDTRSMRERGIASIRGGLPNMSGIPDSSPVITGGDPDSQYNQRGADEVIGSFNGRPITKGEADARAGRLQTASGYNMGPAKDPMQDALISALRGGGGSGGGFSAPSSNARDINARFDSLAKNLEGRYGSKGQGNLARRLLELEGMRSSALDADARNMSSLRGQDMTAASNAASNRMQAAQVAASMLRDRNAALAAGSKATADAQAKAQEMQDKALGQQDAAWKSLSEEIRTQYKDDPQTGESILSRIQSAGSDQIGEIANLHGADRMAAISDLVKSGQIAQSADDTRGWFSGQKDSGLPRVAGAPRAPEFFNDVFNGGSEVMPAIGREFQDLIYGGGQVVPLDNGQVVSNAVVGDNDAYRKRVAKRAAEDAARRSSLRGE